jgi:hypothetical protein
MRPEPFFFNKMPIYNGVPFQDLMYVPLKMNKGIVLNVDSFPGIIEIADSKMTSNTIFIPEILATERPNVEQIGMTMFYNSLTYELEFAACNYKN